MAIFGRAGAGAGIKNILAKELKKGKKKKAKKRHRREIDIVTEARFERFLGREAKKAKGLKK